MRRKGSFKDIISALDFVVEQAKDSHLSNEFWQRTEEAFEYLTDKMKLSKIQVLFIGLLIDSDRALTWSGIGEKLGVSRIKAMVYSDEMDSLVKNRWVMHTSERSFRDNMSNEAFVVLHNVHSTLRKNKPFVPEQLENMPSRLIISKINNFMKDLGNCPFTQEHYDLCMDMIKANPNDKLCKEILSIDDEYQRKIFLLCIQAQSTVFEHFDINEAYQYFDNYEWSFALDDLAEGISILFDKGIIEQENDEGMINPCIVVLTKKFRKEFMGEVQANKRKRNSNFAGMIDHKSIKPRKLFFNPEDQESVERLFGLFEKKRFKEIQKRLKQEGQRQGIACLFYGAAGVGKTELTRQLALKTGRNIMQVDISSIKDKFVGESEKAMKQLFEDYREACHNKAVTPILLINECDAILNKRSTDPAHAVDKMENALQNILLQELEDLEGIVICTTNLQNNLDTAFQRRFIMKIEFHMPNADTRAKIIGNMIPTLSEPNAYALASQFCLSGGQIENISRKSSIDYVLTGSRPGLEELKKYCQEEVSLQAVKHNTRPIGFDRN